MLAALLGWSQATFASKLEPGDGEAKVTREVDGGLETIKVKLPAIVTTDLRLNEPRSASLPNITSSEERSGGNDCVRTCSSGWSPCPYQKNKQQRGTSHGPSGHPCS